jgi:predicted transcriptional regulator
VESELSADAREFITRHIVSIEELEVLLMLYEGRDRDWNSAEINERLRSQEASIAKWLDSLLRARLIRETGGRYRFAPESETLERQTTALAQAYRDLRIKVIEFIFSKPDDNLLSFIRAFDLRKRP